MRSEDEDLVARIRSMMKRRKGYSEQKMFGGVCFMINGNMCVGPWKGSLIVRLRKENHEQTQSEPHVKPMDITGKVMKGWARVEPEAIIQRQPHAVDPGVQCHARETRQPVVDG